MVAPHPRSLDVTRSATPTLLRSVRALALATALVAALAGCGRKSGLDPPPGAVAAPPPQAQAAPAGLNGTAGLVPSGQPKEDAQPTAPARRIFLDGLLN